MTDKILIVDDDEAYKKEFIECFQDEYRIIRASSGEEALKIIKKPNDIDLVLLDIKMPGLSGIEVLIKIKTVSPDINVIILTGYSSKDTAIDALRGHADNFIDKSSKVDEIRNIIEKVLETKKGIDDPNALDIEGKINKVKRFIERNALKKVSLEDAAKSVYLSPKYLSRIFKQTTRMTFNKYRLKIKTKKAKELLKKTGYNIDQISEKMGYMNTESFIRIFKKITKCTPTEYRNKKKKKK